MSQQLPEIVHAESGLTDDRPQRTAIQLPMIGDDDLGKGFVTPQYQMASVLPNEHEARAAKSTNALPARYSRQSQTATTKASNVSSGTGMPSSVNASTYPSMASLMFARASCLVRP